MPVFWYTTTYLNAAPQTVIMKTVMITVGKAASVVAGQADVVRRLAEKPTATISNKTGWRI